MSAEGNAYTGSSSTEPGRSGAGSEYPDCERKGVVRNTENTKWPRYIIQGQLGLTILRSRLFKGRYAVADLDL